MSAFGSGQATMQPQHAALSYGGFWIRFAAALIDGILLNIVLFGLASATGSSLYTFDLDDAAAARTIGGVTFLSFAIPAAYTIGFWLLSNGATPGKMALRLSVVRSEDGGPISTGQAIGRYLGYIVSSLLFMLGFIWAGFDVRKQAWHDKLASTVVVRRG